ncbi:MAG: molybdopterin molybdotransferase MoeA [Anaerolineales bacterium]|nr:MAG: molybdopterin molybdotransferase MoeA [Anaerolineales bacterium]
MSQAVPAVEPISVDEALDYILRHMAPLGSHLIPIVEALDRVLAEDIVSTADIPPFANSAMDGYAVRSQDVVSADLESPVVLRVITEVPAGAVPHRAVEPGTAARIMTGAPVPPGSDAVVPFELTSEGQDGGRQTSSEVAVYRPVGSGDNVRTAGEDIRTGQTVLIAGRVLRPPDIGVLAAMGHPQVRVVRRPRVAILATGDELVDVDQPITPGKIRNSNEYTSIALVKRYGGLPVPLGIARDTVKDLTGKIRAGLSQDVQLFLTSAGVSVGDFDVVKNVLDAEGEMHFWQVAIKPGKPLAFGSVEGVPLLGLPGNPVAAMVAFEVFARPAILKLGGHKSWQKPSVTAVLDEDVHNSGRRHYMRAQVRRETDGYHVTTRGSGVRVQGSGILSSLVWADGLVVVPEEVTFIEAGSSVDVWMLDWPESVF